MSTNQIYFQLRHDVFESQIAEGALEQFYIDEERVRSNSDESFTHPMPARILDLSNITIEDYQTLGNLFGQTPLYRVQLTFMLDQALRLRQDKPEISKIVDLAFHPHILPIEVKANAHPHYNFSGALAYPFMDQLSSEELVQIYFNFIDSVRVDDESGLYDLLDFSKIIHDNPTAFLRQYDGYFDGIKGCVKIKNILENARRIGDRGDNTPLDEYSERGERVAQSMGFSSQGTILEAWLHADQFQLRRCEFLHRVLRVFPDAITFGWVKTDIFTILEREAMKQVFAKSLVTDYDVNMYLLDCPRLKKAILHNASDGVDSTIQTLMTQILNEAAHYNESARGFCLEAARRDKEYREMVA